MEKIRVPYKMGSHIATFAGEWTAEEIDAGLAGEPTSIEIEEAWYEPNGELVTDSARIAELERTIHKD